MEWTIASVVMGVDTTAMMTVGGWMFLQMQALSNDVRQESRTCGPFSKTIPTKRRAGPSFTG